MFVRLHPVEEGVGDRSPSIAVLVLLSELHETLVEVGRALVEQTLGDSQSAVARETHGYTSRERREVVIGPWRIPEQSAELDPPQARERA